MTPQQKQEYRFEFSNPKTTKAFAVCVRCFAMFHRATTGNQRVRISRILRSYYNALNANQIYFAKVTANHFVAEKERYHVYPV